MIDPVNKKYRYRGYNYPVKFLDESVIAYAGFPSATRYVTLNHLGTAIPHFASGERSEGKYESEYDLIEIDELAYLNKLQENQPVICWDGPNFKSAHILLFVCRDQGVPVARRLGDAFEEHFDYCIPLTKKNLEIVEDKDWDGKISQEMELEVEWK